MNAVPFVVRAGALAALFALGCAKPEDAAKAKAEQEAITAELKKAKAEIEEMRAEIARARAERGLPPAPAPKVEPEQPFEERLSKLHANYNANAITLTEWTALKAKVITQIPAAVPAGEARSLGQRLIDLKRVYDASALTLTEWADAKSRLVAQAPHPARPAPALDRELTELKRAYDANALTLSEWTTAKAEIVKWAK
jgi:hypothetical protein